ncbi:MULTISPECIES: hypothetical protein [Trichocoleus]|uniref:Uncharacterized protein n=1 Tax=Trichocoleus desertorum GB2-A4 TaxID=2933944 RepID=A0ABV0JCU7_9CYAN|nr:hypothetical protein [Trichocoleus sp. FACHB-46]MBD1864253.1 hypothetical protein [Trichocoleus sp. FACHB-46]
MVVIQPTDKWNSRTVATPHGLVKRPPGARSFEVTAQKGQWLIDNKFATVATESPAPERAHPPVNSSLNTEILSEAQPVVTTSEQYSAEASGQTSAEQTDPPPVLEPWQQKLLEFFNSQQPGAIAEAIRGIGPKTDEDLIAARPLTWEKIEGILSDRQMDAAKKWTESSSH